MRKKVILITGAAGEIGHALVYELAKNQPHQIVTMPNINTAQPSPTSEEDSTYGSPSQTPIQETHPNATPYSGHTTEEILKAIEEAVK